MLMGNHDVCLISSGIPELHRDHCLADAAAGILPVPREHQTHEAQDLTIDAEGCTQQTCRAVCPRTRATGSAQRVPSEGDFTAREPGVSFCVLPTDTPTATGCR